MKRDRDVCQTLFSPRIHRNAEEYQAAEGIVRAFCRAVKWKMSVRTLGWSQALATYSCRSASMGWTMAALKAGARTVVIRLKFNVFDGTSQAEVDAAFDEIQEDFQQWNIQFLNAGADFNAGTPFGVLDSRAEAADMTTQYADSHTTQLNIYVADVQIDEGDPPGPDFAGNGTLPWTDDVLDVQGGIIVDGGASGWARRRSRTRSGTAWVCGTPITGIPENSTLMEPVRRSRVFATVLKGPTARGLTLTGTARTRPVT